MSPPRKNHQGSEMLKSSQHHAGPCQEKAVVWISPPARSQLAGVLHTVAVFRDITVLLAPLTNGTSECPGLTAAGKCTLFFRARVLSSRSEGERIDHLLKFAMNSWLGLGLKPKAFPSMGSASAPAFQPSLQAEAASPHLHSLSCPVHQDKRHQHEHLGRIMVSVSESPI